MTDIELGATSLFFHRRTLQPANVSSPFGVAFPSLFAPNKPRFGVLPEVCECVVATLQYSPSCFYASFMRLFSQGLHWNVLVRHGFPISFCYGPSPI